MLTIPRIRVDVAKLSNLMLVLIVTAVSVMFFYFIKTDRIGGEFLASIFSITQDEKVEDENLEFDSVLIGLGQYSSLISSFD